MTKQKPDLAAALADVSGSSRRRPAPLRSGPAPAVMTASKGERNGTGRNGGAGKTQPVYQPPSRSGTAPITGHFPRQVRDQLKILAIERSATLHDLMAEAYNDLFAKYGKAEIAPRHPGDN